MTDSSKALSIIAYYLSEYDKKAIQILGFDTQRAAFKEISICFNRDNNYLKLRRDEFDALPDSSSHRNGWRNRPAAKDVINIAAYLKQFSFEELTELVKSLIAAESGALVTIPETIETSTDERIYSETELENIINFEDSGATVKIKTSSTTVRVYNPYNVLEQVKIIRETEAAMFKSELMRFTKALNEVKNKSQKKISVNDSLIKPKKSAPTDIEPNNPIKPEGKIFVEKNMSNSSNSDVPLSSNQETTNAVKEVSTREKRLELEIRQLFEYRTRLEQQEAVAAKIEQERKERIYSLAKSKMQNDDILQIKEAIFLLETILDYKDSTETIVQAKLKMDKIVNDEKQLRDSFKAQKLCQHCGGKFKGLFKKHCSVCGKIKDY